MCPVGENTLPEDKCSLPMDLMGRKLESLRGPVTGRQLQLLGPWMEEAVGDAESPGLQTALPQALAGGLLQKAGYSTLSSCPALDPGWDLPLPQYP